MITIGFTGHRPTKMGGYKIPNPTYISIFQTTEDLLLELKPEKCITGVALGYDQLAANICINLGIPFIAAVPFEGQEKKWPEQTQKDYYKLLKKADEIVIVSNGDYSANKMQIRNEWIVNHSDAMIACFDGVSKGGTANCIEFAKEQNKPIYIIKPI